MKQLKVELMMSVKDEAVEEIQSTIYHHIERLIDIENWPEIHSIYYANSEVITEEEARKNIEGKYTFDEWQKIFNKVDLNILLTKIQNGEE